MYFWDVLELEPTSDVKTIKRAYAKLLKIYHPEDDPEGFQVLKEAYDAAIKYTKNHKKYIENIDENSEVIEDKIEKAEKAPVNGNIVDELSEQEISTEEVSVDNRELINIINSIEEQQLKIGPNEDEFYKSKRTLVPKDFLREETASKNDLGEFLNQLNSLYWDFERRIELKNWRALFNDGIIWDIEFMKAIDYSIIEFLQEHYLFPRNIWKYLNSIFNWTQREEELIGVHGEDAIDRIMESLNSKNALSYNNLVELKNLDFESYLWYREQAFYALFDNDLHDIQINIDRANEIYSFDPEMHYIEAYFLMLRGRNQSAMEIAAAGLVKYPDNINLCMLLARLYYEDDEAKQAIDIIEALVCNEADIMELQLLKFKCYVNLHKFSLAREEFLKLDSNVRNQPEVKKLIVQTYRNLRIRSLFGLVRQPFSKVAKHDYNKLRKEFRINHSHTLLKVAKTLGSIAFKLAIFGLLLGLVAGTSGGIIGVFILLRLVYIFIKKFKNI